VSAFGMMVPQTGHWSLMLFYTEHRKTDLWLFK